MQDPVNVDVKHFQEVRGLGSHLIPAARSRPDRDQTGDNFDDDAVRAAVAFTDGRAILEASGGITLERIPALAQACVALISVGALTHSAPPAAPAPHWP